MICNDNGKQNNDNVDNGDEGWDKLYPNDDTEDEGWDEVHDDNELGKQDILVRLVYRGRLEPIEDSSFWDW